MQNNNSQSIETLFDFLILCAQSFFDGVKSLLNLIKRFVCFCFASIKTNYLVIVIALALGIGFKSYQIYTAPTLYSSSLTIESNYGNAEDIYKLVDVVNDLIAQKKTEEIGKELNISQEVAEKLTGLKVEPVVSQRSQAQLYNTYVAEVDTAIYAPTPIDDYVKKIEDIDYQTQTIRILSYSSTDFLKIQKGLLSVLESNKELSTLRDSHLANIDREAVYLKNSISQLDSIIKVNQQALLNSSQNLTSKEMISLESSYPEGGNFSWLFNKKLDYEQTLSLLNTNKQKDKNLYKVHSPAKQGQVESRIKMLVLFSIPLLLVVFSLSFIYSAIRNDK